MSASKTEQPQRLIIAHLQGEYEAGDRFSDWPLHITLVPWFMGKPGWATELFRRVSADFQACSVELGQRSLGNIEMYGPDADVPVRSIQESTALGVVHGMLLPHFHPFLADTTYVGSRYNPHMSIHENPDPGEGRIIHVGSLSLMQHLGDKGDRQKLILATTRLGDV